MESHRIEPRFQIITVTITTIIILSLIINFLRTFCSHDNLPKIKNKQEITLPKDIKYTQVETGLNVEEFTTFDILKNTFVLVGTIWFKYDKNETDFKTIEKFDFKNGEIIEKSGPFITQDPVSKKEIAYFDIKVEFFAELFFYLFPFEDHRLYLMLINNDNIIYNSSPGNLVFQDKQINVQGWRLHAKNVIEGYDQILINSADNRIEENRSAIIFEFDFFLKGIRLLVSIFLPLLIVFFIELFAMCLDRKDFKQYLLSVSTANIGALIAYRYVLDNLTPKVGYLTLSDCFFFLFLILIFFNFILGNFGPYFTSVGKKVISVSFQLIVILSFTYLLNFLAAC